jgi:membrane-bound lytic murein transglycosylase D
LSQYRISNIEYLISNGFPHSRWKSGRLTTHDSDGASRVTRHASRILLIVMLIALFVCPSGWAQTTHKKTVPIDKRIADLEAEVARMRREADVYTLDGLPDNLTLCDKKIPIFKDDVRERFEREFFQLLENKGLLTIVIKRYFKYLNFINEETKRMAVPSDLIYLVITESYLNPRAVSKASAAGLWQFIKETGKREGLFVSDHLDERYNVKKATRSALSHLKGLHGEFGDWLIAMAAYNAGAGRLREVIENQETRDFFEMYLPEETERYVMRVAAIKEIILNRERYGLSVDEKDLYKPVAVSEVTLETAREVHISTFAKCMDVPYRVFRENNLHLRRYRLPKGTYQINVPSEKQATFLKRLRDYPYISVVRE